MFEKDSETNDVGRSLSFALMMRRCWEREIEQAIESVKRKNKVSDLDWWFRKQWYRARAIDRKKRAGGTDRIVAGFSKKDS